MKAPDAVALTIANTIIPEPKGRTRKVRTDKGKGRGPRKPPSPAQRTQHGEIVELALRGVHGVGKVLRLSQKDAVFILNASDDGRNLYVVPHGAGRVPMVTISGLFAQAFAGSSNPSHNVTVARLLLGETHGGRTVQFLDHDTFNLCRGNLVTEVRATKQRFPIDWQKAEARRTELSEPAFAALSEKHARIGRAVR